MASRRAKLAKEVATTHEADRNESHRLAREAREQTERERRDQKIKTFGVYHAAIRTDRTGGHL